MLCCPHKIQLDTNNNRNNTKPKYLTKNKNTKHEDLLASILTVSYTTAINLNFVAQKRLQCLNHCHRHHGKSPMWINACEHTCYDNNREYDVSLASAGATDLNFVDDDNVGGPAVSYDSAYIHSGCSIDNGAYPGYSDNSSNAFGEAWYCNDGEDVSNLNPSDFDEAYIHTGCDVGVHYSKEAQAWYCKDDGPNGQVDLVYIHPDCSNGAHPEYCNDGSCAFGDGWYCNDGKDVRSWDPAYFDLGFIHPGCDAGVYWDGNLEAWYCQA